MTDNMILVVKNLCKKFDSHQIISLLSFSIQRESQVALFAPSGAGKSTLINILAGLEPATSGSVQIDKQVRMSIIFQQPRLFSYMTVEENILLPHRISKCEPSAQVMSEYIQWLQVCELSSWKDHYPHQLSGGMKQKVSLIRGFLSRPDFVIMDEPFQSIGEISKRAIVAHIKQNYPVITSLLVTHDPDEVAMLADSVLFFNSANLSAPIHLAADVFHNIFTDISRFIHNGRLELVN